MFQALLLAILVACLACDRPRAEPEAIDSQVCTTIEIGHALAGEVRETSGLALSSHGADVTWTHNDRGNEPVLFSLSADGSVLNRVRVTGAELIDWEDIEAAPCAGGRCLYIGDIGDNDAVRSTITIYEIEEPSLEDGASSPATAMHARYPDGAHNAESLFVLRSGDIYIVTKGDTGPVTLYRYAAGARADTTVTLERVRVAMDRPVNSSDYVTGATASPDGRWVAIRTYNSLFFYPAESFVSGAVVTPITVDLRALRESQGEGIAMSADGTVWLTSEAGGIGERPGRAKLMCTLPAEAGADEITPPLQR